MKFKKFVSIVLLTSLLTGNFCFISYADDTTTTTPAGGSESGDGGEGESEDLEYDYTAVLEQIQEETKNLHATVKEIKAEMQGKKASSVTGIGLINSSNRLMDYKPTDTSFMDKVRTSSDIVEELTGNSSRFVGNAIAKTGDETKDRQRQFVEQSWLYWLINHNQYERWVTVTVSEEGSKTVIPENNGAVVDLSQQLQPMMKSDFLMNMYKALYGPICSRSVQYNTKSVRSGRVMESDEDYVPDVDNYYQDSKTGQTVSAHYESTGWDFSEGDYYFAVTSNVKELYFKELIDMGVLDLQELSVNPECTFLEEYQKYSSGSEDYPVWDTMKPSYNAFGMRIQQLTSLQEWSTYNEEQCPWGQGYTMTEGPNYSREYDEYGNLILQYLTPGGEEYSTLSPNRNFRFFGANESITGIEALRYVEKLLRIDEDMTETEAQIIAYKYGVNYLNRVNDEDRTMLTYLVAKGIISFEDENDFSSLYVELTNEFAFRILYRLANESARTTFKEVQLTDSDNFWIKQGYGQNNLKFVVPVRSNDQIEVPNVYTTEIEDTNVAYNQPNRIERMFSHIFGAKEAYAAEGDHTFVITKTYSGDPDKLLYKGYSLSYLKEAGGRNWQCPSFLGYDDRTGVIQFEIKATDEYIAALAVDSNLSYDGAVGAGSTKVMNVAGVSKVKASDNNTEITLIPATSLKDISNELIVVQDKLLKNSKTNTTAVLLPNSKMALVGNQVIRSDSVMLKSVDGTVYYDLEVIKSLLSQAYTSTLDQSVIYAGNSLQEVVTPVYIDGNTTAVAKTYTARINSRALKVGREDNTIEMEEQMYYNLTLASQGKNNIIYNYTGDRSSSGTNNAISNSITVIVDFEYVLPRNNNVFTEEVIQALTKKSLLSNDLTIKDVNTLLMKRPDVSNGGTKALADWWDSNVYLSNAITQVIYGASDGAGYVQCGYLVPNIYFLYKDDDVSKQLIKSFLNEVDGYLPASYKSNYVDKVTEIATSDIAKLLPDGPKFSRTMYNNATGNSSRDMWKQLNENRRIYLCKGEGIENGSVSYLGDKLNGGNFVITASGSVYRAVDDDLTVQYSQTTSATNPYKNKLIFTDKVSGNNTDKANLVEGLTCTRDGIPFTYIGMDGSFMRFVRRTPTVGYAYYLDISGRDTDNTYRDFKIHALMSETNLSEDKGEVDYQETAKMFQYSSDGNNKCRDYNTMLMENKLWDNTSEYAKATIADYISSNAYDAFVGNDGNKIMFNDRGEVGSIGESSYDTTSQLASGRVPDSTYLGKQSDKKRFSRVDIWSVNGRQIANGHGYNPVKAAGLMVMEVSSNFFKVNANKEIVETNELEILNQTSVYPSSINQGMMDAMISSEVEAKRIGDLAIGDYLYINGSLYYKTGQSEFTSFPIVDETLLHSIDKTILSGNTDNIEKDITAYINTIPVNVRGLGVMSSLGAYVKSADLSYFSKNIQNAYKNYVSGNMQESNFLYDNMSVIKDGNIACKIGNTYKIDKDGGNNTVKYGDIVANSVVIEIELDPDLLCRLFDSDNRTYSLMLSVSTLSEGYIQDLPFYEELNLTRNNMIELNSRQVHFRVLDYANELRDQFLEDHRKAFAGDLIKLFKVTCIDLMMYVIVMSWVGYAVLRYGVFYNVLEVIYKPFANSTKGGIDLLKIFTLGIYNMESEPNFMIMAGGNILLIFMVYCVFTFL